ncbi:hypothetical protein HanIR_Chr05g0252781 [Helianthus annuus]|nr:hypothetical protein HanIR_Chr05g0252781 [Helianthus annuus]
MHKDTHILQPIQKSLPNKTIEYNKICITYYLTNLFTPFELEFEAELFQAEFPHQASDTQPSPQHTHSKTSTNTPYQQPLDDTTYTPDTTPFAPQ